MCVKYQIKLDTLTAAVCSVTPLTKIIVRNVILEYEGSAWYQLEENMLRYAWASPAREFQTPRKQIMEDDNTCEMMRRYRSILTEDELYELPLYNSPSMRLFYMLEPAYVTRCQRLRCYTVRKTDRPCVCEHTLSLTQDEVTAILDAEHTM